MSVEIPLERDFVLEEDDEDDNDANGDQEFKQGLGDLDDDEQPENKNGSRPDEGEELVSGEFGEHDVGRL